MRKCSALNMDLSQLESIPDLEELLEEDNNFDSEEHKIDPEFLERMRQSSLRISQSDIKPVLPKMTTRTKFSIGEIYEDDDEDDMDFLQPPQLSMKKRNSTLN